MEEKHTLDLSILKKIREMIIVALKALTYTLGEQYKLSAANEKSSTFEIDFLMKGSNASNIRTWSNSVENAMNKKFGNGVTITKDGKKLKINLRTFYQLQASQFDAEKKEAGTVGRPKTAASELETQLIGCLHKNTTMRLGERGSGFVIVPRHTGENFVTMGFAGESTFVKALCCLETEFGNRMRISETGTKWQFTVCCEEIVSPGEIETREAARKFLNSLRSALLPIDREATVASSYILLARKDKVEIPITLTGSANEMSVCYKRIADVFPASKTGPIVTISTTEESRNLYSKELRFVKNPQKGVQFNEASKDGVVHRTYTHISLDYEEFYFLPFNRKIINSHVADLIESVKQFGIISFIVIAETDCIDGVMRKWIVDGQHRYHSFKAEGLPIMYTKVEISTKEEMVRLIAKLNSTSQKWSLKNYLDAWVSLRMFDYTYLKNKAKVTKLPLTLLIQICENKQTPKSAQTAFLDGRFKIVDQEKAEREIDYLVQPQQFIPKNRDVFVGLYMFIRKEGEQYDNQRMLKQLEKQKDSLPFIQGDEMATISEKFEIIYNAA